MFQLRHIDHIAIRVADPERSARWYEAVLGMQRQDFPRWNNYPVFLSSGLAGIAIFPAREGESTEGTAGRSVCIDHFAFWVDAEAFEAARRHYEQLGLAYEFQDHHYFHSVYVSDPDGHIVELTTPAGSGLR